QAHPPPHAQPHARGRPASAGGKQVKYRVGGFMVLALMFLGGCAGNRPQGVVRSPNTVSDDEDDDTDDSEAALFRKLDETFGRTGEIKDGVYRLVTPRTDLNVTVDGMD